MHSQLRPYGDVKSITNYAKEKNQEWNGHAKILAVLLQGWSSDRVR